MNIRKALLMVGLAILCLPVHAQSSDFSTIGFNRADSMAMLLSGHSLEKPRLLAEQLTSSLGTDVEKFRAIYTWVCKNVSNDYDMYSRILQKQLKWKDEPEKLHDWYRKYSPHIFKTLRENRRTICTGYAYLLRQLSLYAGIPCQVIDGYGRSATANVGGEGMMNHSWNAVFLNGKWYLCDPTWSSGRVDGRTGVFIPEYNDAYFLPDPSVFILNHYPADTSWTLLENAPDLHDFLNAPLVYSHAISNSVIPEIPDALHQEVEKNDSLTIILRGPPENADNIRIRISRGANTREIDPQVEICDQRQVIRYAFSSRGKYDVHILINGQVVVTYTVKVI